MLHGAWGHERTPRLDFRLVEKVGHNGTVGHFVSSEWDILSHLVLNRENRKPAGSC